ncbi:MAG: hypothetical protein CMP47_06890 [Rickettsiales bacterium]|nr:hypothetical protein [Rickettsiales bacterium]
MEQKDIENYIKAKKAIKLQKLIFLFVLAIEIIWFALYLTGNTTDIINLVAISSAVGLLLSNNSLLQKNSQHLLLDIIKRQIDRDPQALQYLAKQSKADNQ